MNKWKCKICEREFLAFAEDIKKLNYDSFAYLGGFNGAEPHICEFELIKAGHVNTIHGESGFMTEDTIFDSTETIHVMESKNLAEAEEYRELKSYVKAMKEK